jgi:predicted acetyltransferase
MLHVVPLHSEAQSIAYIYGVATRAEYRNRGIASALLTSALHNIDSGRYHRTILIPADQNSAKFYEKFGFKATGELFNCAEFNIDYDLGTGNREQDFVMERNIY